MSSQKRIELIDVLRGFAAVAMIIGHSIIVYPIDVSAVAPFDFAQTVIYMFHMELFFVVAGSVYRCDDYRSMMISKAKRLLIPYFFFGIIAVAFHHIGGDAVHNQVGFIDGIKKTLFYGGNYWFLYTLFIVCAIFPIVIRVGKKIKGFDLMLAAALMLIKQFVPLTSILTVSSVVYYLPYFIIGHRFKSYLSENERLPRPAHLCFALCFAVAVIAAAAGLTEKINIVPLEYICALGFIYPVYLISRKLIFVSAKNKTAAAINAFVKNCSRYSLQLYLFNPFILVVVRAVLCSVLHIRSAWLIVSVLVVCNLAVTLLLCSYVIERIPVLCELCGIKRRKQVKAT